LGFLDLALEHLGFPNGPRLRLCDIAIVSWLAHACSPGAHPWILFTAVMPALAAALYGIHSSCEFAKLARNSHAMARALDLLRVHAEKLVDGPSLDVESLKPLIRRFLALCTDEAAGWHEMLWDKNVPLG